MKPKTIKQLEEEISFWKSESIIFIVLLIAVLFITITAHNNLQEENEMLKEQIDNSQNVSWHNFVIIRKNISLYIDGEKFVTIPNDYDSFSYWTINNRTYIKDSSVIKKEFEK